MRRLVVILTLLATAGSLGACGSGSRTAATTGTHTSPVTSASTSVRPLTKAQAIAFARAVNLTSADVPGFRATATNQPEHETAREKQLERELLNCTGGALNSSDGPAEASSKDFKLEHDLIHLSVNSKVSVARTPALAAKELTVIRSNHVRGCLSHYLSLLLKNQISKEQRHPSTVNPISISISQGTPPAPGATGSFWWRITATITVRNIRLPFYIDILGFVYGPAEVSLLSSGALKPFPAAIQEHLYRLLLQRARAHVV